MKQSARGYELYGSIAVVEAEPRVAKRMAQRLLAENKNIKSVVRKGGAVSGEYRTRRFIHVAGARNYLADYKENGCVFRFDIRKVFFSTKLGFERKRISDQVHDGEKVMVLFAGIGPYAIEIAKTHKKCKVVAIELNKAACGYMRANLKLNKVSNVSVEQGDVSKFAKRYAHFASRIIMPLPKEAEKFLPTAIRMCSRNCTLHYYTFCKSDKVKEEASKIRELVSSIGRKSRLLGYRTVRPYSATEIEAAFDLRIS